MASRAQPVKQAQNVRRSLVESSWYHPRTAPPRSVVALATCSAIGSSPENFYRATLIAPADAGAIRCSHYCFEVVRGVPRRPDAWSLSLLERLAPFQAPVVADQVYDFAVLLVEFVRNLEDGNHQSAFGSPCRMTAARRTPDELAGTAGQAFLRSILVDQATLDHEGLLEHDVFMVGQFSPRVHFQQ